MTATPTTVAPASRSASTAASTEPPVVEVSSTASTAPARDVGALDPPLQAVRLALLADHERVQRPAPGGGRVQHRRRDRVGAQGQPAHGVVLPVGGRVEHHLAHERGGDGVQGDPAQVHVVVGLPPAGQGDPAVHDGLVGDLGQQLVAWRSRPGSVRARP